MKLRVISLLLAIVMMVLLIPAPASAAAAGPDELKTQVRDTYRRALRSAGKGSFNGYCGSLVNWQTYLLGIDAEKNGSHGKNAFDLYSSMDTTTGGYRVKAYPAGQYSMKSALNAITCNGTVDAYNILVGFQKTTTSAGSRYGHAVFIHGIVDGMVYYVESFSTYLDGKYWSEGTPISCSIDTFCDAYARWTEFDGVAYFGLKTYADACDVYASGMYATAVSDTAVYAEPADPGLFEGTLSGDSVVAGEVVKITALLQTPGGRYYYQIDRNSGTEYVPAEKLMQIADDSSDLRLTGGRIPTVIRKGKGFVIRGTVSSQNADIRSVKVSVYNPAAGSGPVLEGVLEVNGKFVDLDTWKLDRYMTFSQLKSGEYRIAITAQVQTHVMKNGVLTEKSNTVTVWNSRFRVVSDWNQYATVTFDGNGGQAYLTQTVIPNQTALGSLPEAVRTGYRLAGWSLDPEGEQMITEESVLDGNTTLYAQWEKDGQDLSGWQQVDGRWCYYLSGVAMGWTTSSEGSDRNRLENWQQPGGALLAATTALHVAGPCVAASQPETVLPSEAPIIR